MVKALKVGIILFYVCSELLGLSLLPKAIHKLQAGEASADDVGNAPSWLPLEFGQIFVRA